MAQLLLMADATVTVAHSKTENLAELAQEADILVVAIGRGHFVTKIRKTRCCSDRCRDES